MKHWMPVFLVVAIAAGVAFAAFSTNVPREPIAATPAPPLTPQAPDPDHDQDPDRDPDRDPDQPTGDTPPPPSESVTGVVREHFDVAQYTYLHLAGDAGGTWAAVYRAPVKDGQTVTVVSASVLRGFHSRELNRDFKEIYFGVLPGFETAPAASALPSASAAASNAVAAGSLKHVAGAMTIADLALHADQLVGKEVTVVGRVSKETDGVLDRNWIHLVDGTGDPADKSNDLLVTTNAMLGIGDDVVATGTVRTNQDFGSGYAYKFLLEGATVTPSK